MRTGVKCLLLAAMAAAPAWAVTPPQPSIDCPQCPSMLRIPEGSFLMGSPDSKKGPAYADQKPQRRVTIRAFVAGVYEVTVAQWDACVRDGGCPGPRPAEGGGDSGRMPVENVSWDDAQSYVAWLSKKAGRKYRLLSEAEWEYAARAGSTGDYPWGPAASHDFANYGAERCCEGAVAGRDQWMKASPVGLFPPNAFGLHDMNGNVREWVEDCYHNTYDNRPVDGSAEIRDAEFCSRVIRGGDYEASPDVVRSAHRALNPRSARTNGVGFRVARD